MPPDGITRQLVETRHGVLNIWRTAPVAGPPPLVCLHMSPQSGRQFHPIAPLLAPERELLMVDRLGFGHSDAVPRPLEFPEYGRATLDALDALGIETFDLLGIHTGTSEAVSIVSAVPDRVRAVALAALPVFSEEELREFRAVYADPPQVLDDGSHFATIWARFTRWQAEAPGWPVELTNERVLDHVRAWPSSAAMYSALFDYEIGPLLQTIAQPLLALAPKDDIWVQTQRGLELLPAHARIVDLSHLTHEIFVLHPAELAGHIGPFFATPN
ncbi:MAG: alpha/beta fold hydrolase [Gaiellaceae bacterium]